MREHEIETIARDFVFKFNRMCQSERRNFLVKKRNITYETGTQVKTYHVNYQIRKRRNAWQVDAVSDGFWIFKKRFPLLRISQNQGKIRFSGPFTADISDFEPKLLKQKLDEYMEICKKQPADVFAFA